MRESLPSFFGFEAVGVLMYNFESNVFFTDPDTSKDEKKESLDNGSSASEGEDDGEMGQEKISMGSETPLRKKKKKDKPISYHKEEQLTDEQKHERIRATHSKKFMNFPTNSGISGFVFKTKELYFSNNASKETKFVEEIDNQSVCTDVKNFMLGPVFGTKDSETPCAIIQFINKLDANDKTKLGKISSTDEQKFKSMQKLLGMCVENTNEMSTTIKVSFDVQDVMRNIQKRMQEENDREATSDADAIIKELTEHLNAIKTSHHKLTELRTKTII